MKARLQAFGLHLFVSAFLVALAAILVFFVWYPYPYSVALGVSSVFLLLLLVDVVIGPLLTLLVYDPAKASLRFDLFFIVLLQLSAFFYGIWSLGTARPAWVVFNVDRFDLVQANALDERDADRVLPEYRKPPLWGAEWVASFAPADAQANNQITIEALYSGLDIAQRPLLYRPIAEASQNILRNLKGIEELWQFNAREDVESQLRGWPEADAWLPMMSKDTPMVVLMNRSELKVVAVVNLKPWSD